MHSQDISSGDIALSQQQELKNRVKELEDEIARLQGWIVPVEYTPLQYQYSIRSNDPSGEVLAIDFQTITHEQKEYIEKYLSEDE